MRTGKDLVDKPIISVADGLNLGRVKDLYLDGALTRVEGLHLGSEGLLSRTPHFVPADALVVLGVDAVLVKSGEVVRDGADDERWEAWLRREQLKGREVTTPGGTRIGRVGDVLVDAAGQVTGFKLSRVYVEGPVQEHQSLTRGAVLDPGNAEEPMKANLADVEDTSLETDS